MPHHDGPTTYARGACCDASRRRFLQAGVALVAAVPLLPTTDALDVWPLNNAPGAVVNLMNPRHVEAVFIAGKVKKWRGSLVGVDLARVKRLAQEARDGVMRRANVPVNLLG